MLKVAKDTNVGKIISQAQRNWNAFKKVSAV